MENKKKNISRRDFLRAATMVGAATAASGALAGCSAGDSSLPSSWDYETDVVVIGFGMAGASTALAVDDAGAEVIILEKMDEEKSGGNSKVSGNILYHPDDRDDGIAYFRAMCRYNMHDITDEMVDTWVDSMMENITWLEENAGVNMTLVPESVHMGPEMPFLPGAETNHCYLVDGQVGGGVLYTPVADLVKARRLEVLYETAANKLLTDADGNVVGVIATQGGSEITLKARKGVVLCCGGFEFNAAMRANYLRGPMYGLGTIGNTGDGIRMAQALGADLWHMNNSEGPIRWGFLSEEFGEDDYPEAIRSIAISSPGYFWSDQLGNRFMNEGISNLHGKAADQFNYFDGWEDEFIRNPCWMIFDQAGMDAGPLCISNSEAVTMKATFAGWYSKYMWSMDNTAELEKGWIKTGDSIEALAEEIGVDVDTLSATLARYNEVAETGVDEDYGRSAIAPLSGPFFAIQLHPAMVNTQGGPKRNHKAEVLHVEGHPIPRLYSVGECGSVYSWQYQGGGNLGECLAFGRIAGANAAANESL